MKKKANSDDESLVRVKAMLVSRQRTVEEINTFFNNAKPARAKDVKKMEKLLVQAPAAQVQTPNLQKEAAPKTDTDRAKKYGRIGALAASAGTVAAGAKKVMAEKGLVKANPKASAALLAGTMLTSGAIGTAAGRLTHRAIHGKATGKSIEKSAAAMLEAHKNAPAEEVIGKNVTEFFEKKAYLTEAQKRFPELLKVGASETSPQAAPTKKPAGAIPARPLISGGQV